MDLFESKKITDPKKKLEFYNSFSQELTRIVTLDLYLKSCLIPNKVLRQFFTFFASYEEYYVEGLKYFSRFPVFIKAQSFNSIKAFLFYFAYQTKRFNSEEVKILLNQKLINASIVDNKSYLDFCMYYFYRGLYCIQNKDFFMASYYYANSVKIGIKNNTDNLKFLNGFNSQMIRSLCLLKYLTDFEISNTIFREGRIHRSFDDYLLIDHEDVAYCLDFIKENKRDLNSFKEFVLKDVNFENCSLKGLAKVAEEEIIFKEIKGILEVYKRLKLAKLASATQIDFNLILKILQKKVLEGEISIKYDENEDIIEVSDIDPGLKERVNKTKELYGMIVEGNKNMFLDLKNKKFDKLSGKSKNLEVNIIDNRLYEREEYMDEDFD